MLIRTLTTLTGLLALAPLASSQGLSTIAFESFDYPAGTGMHDAMGGTGWANAWWSNAAGSDNCVVATPGLDAIGGVGQTSADDQGSYRFPSTAGFENLLDYQVDPNGIFGADDTTIWISFDCQRMPGGDDQFGGLSLNHQFVAEHLFLGSPNSWNLWGYHDDPWNVSGVGNIVNTVATSNIDAASRLVYRIDFLAGPERLRLWIDPVVPHPDTPADIDDMIHDFRFNEIGIKSGLPLSVNGYLFDAITIEAPNVGTGTAYCFGDGSGGVNCPCGNFTTDGSGCANGTGSGGLLTAIGSTSVATDSLKLFATGLVANQPGLFFQGDNAVGGGSGVPFGDGLRCAGGGVVRMQIAVASSTGEAETTVPIAATTGVAAGDVKRYQLWYRDPATSPCGLAFNLTNGLEISWQP